MDLAWNDRRTRQFATNIGLITSDGPHGPNVMSAEWTHHLSYAPSLIATCIRDADATAKNIEQSKAFGVNLAAEGQNVICSAAGGETGLEVDKIAVLKALGIEFYPGTKINAPMIKGVAMNAECRLVQALPLGDHITFIGAVVEISADENAKPLVYHSGKYWTLGAPVQKPPPDVLAAIERLVAEHRKA